MIKKRMSLSLIALVGSVFLFVIASFAWLVVTEFVDVGNIIDIQDVDVSATLYVSDDNITFVEATSINFQNQVPGDIKYYKIDITNNSSFQINTQVSLYGYSNTYTEIGGDTSNFNAGRNLADVVLLNTSNSKNSDAIINQTLSSLIESNIKVVTHENVSIGGSETVQLFFSFTMPTDVGNDYQNLRLDFTNIYVRSFN